MARKKKKVPGLNASSTADISFILLIFFLVTTSMDTDMGLARRLPQPPEPNQEDAQIDVKERNVLNVRLNAAGNLMVNHDFIDINQLRERAKEFIQNKANNPKLPELHAKETARFVADCSVRTAGAGRDYGKAVRNTGHVVSMAHPGDALLWQIVKQLAFRI